MRVRWMAIVPVLALAGGLWAEGSKSALDARVAKALTVQWSGVRYEKFVATANPAVSQHPRYSGEILTLTCQVEVRDPNLILGIGREWVITQMSGAQGQPLVVPTSAQPSYRSSETYEPLHYTRRLLPRAPVPRWRFTLARILRLPPPVPGPAPVIYELQPYGTRVNLRSDVLAQAGGELASIKGRFHVLVAESIESIDVPFEPNDMWVHLAPGVDIRVREAVWTQDFHRYRIETTLGGRDIGRIPTIGAPLPSRLIVSLQFLGADGKVMPRGNYPALLGGGNMEYGASRGGERIKAFRYFIAVNPADRQIPFELTHIPLPDPNQQD